MHLATGTLLLVAAASPATRGETGAAFERRCIPPGCVAPRSNISDTPGRRAMPAGRVAVPGATRFHRGLLGAAGPDRRLPDAAKRRDWLAVRALLDTGAEVDTRHPDGTTSLHWAAHWDEADAARRLLGYGADPNATSDLGVTPLSLACTNASPAMTDLLLEAGANPDLPVGTGETPLMTAARTGNLRVVRALLQRGASVAGREPGQHQTALMWAVSERHAEVVRALIDHGADVEARTTSGFTPLLFAAREGTVDIARMLLASGAAVNHVAADGTSALLVATVRGHVAFARWLLDQGADPNLGEAGYTPLHWAAGSWETELTGPRGISTERDPEWRALRGPEVGRLDLIAALLTRGADVNAQITKPPPRVGFSVFPAASLTGATPFFLAAMSGQPDVMRLLARAGADTRRGTRNGTTPLMAASGVGRVLAETRVTASGSLEAARVAAELGGDVNAVNAAGDTALHGAAHIRGDALVQFLADKGAALSVRNSRGETPLMVAERTIAAGSAPVFMRTSTGDLLRKLGAQ
jgi:ankyrin repeat protein